MATDGGRARRVPELDGVRGIAITLVVLWHFVVSVPSALPHWMVRGIEFLGEYTWSGVDLFFVLSGYLITGILLDSRGSERYFSSFYVRRCFRILPLYVLTVGTFFLAQGFFGHRVAAAVDPAMPWWVYATFTANFWIGHHQQWQVFGSSIWSLAVEEQFYLTLPLIIAITPRRRVLSVMGLMVAAIMVCRALLMHTGAITQTSVHVLIFTRADALLLGGVGAIVVRDYVNVLRTRLLNSLLVVTALAVAAYQFAGWSLMSTPLVNGGYTVLALMYLSFLLLAATQPGSFAARVCRIAPLRHLGNWAYALYLVHQPVQRVMHYLIRRQQPQYADLFDVGISLAALVISLSVAALSWRSFESKMIAIGHRLTAYNPARAMSVPAKEDVAAIAGGR